MILEKRSRNKTALAFITLALLLIGVGIFLSKQNKNNDVSEQNPPANNEQEGNSYPDVKSLKYISALDWPPKLETLDQPFSCTEAGTATERAGATEMRTINGRNYCATEVVNGAAGSIYTQYAYAYAKDNKTNVLTFSLRFSQCGNYNEPSKSECEAERSAFSPDKLLDQYAQSL